MRVAVVYDCLFPWTVGGAERWYRNLAERLARGGHEVTYLTLRQWDASDPPDLPGVKVVAVGPRMELYAAGKRRIWPPLRFGLGLLGHLLCHGRRYDRLHLASFPFFSLLAAGLLRPFFGYRIAVDWHEVWTDDYWRAYLGRLGWLGIAVQRLCARVRQEAYAFSLLHAARAEAIGCPAPVTILPGEYAGGAYPVRAVADPPTLVYAGRLIPEKRVSLLVDAFALLVAQRPEVRLTIFGRGPEQEAIDAQIARLGIGGAIRLPGFVPETEIEAAMAEAAAVVQPSEREGYGMVVVEAAAHGVPVVVVPAPDNAATELVDTGENGFIAADATPAALAAAMAAAVDGGDALRSRTRAWFAANAARLSIAGSTAKILADMDAGRAADLSSR